MQANSNPEQQVQNPKLYDCFKQLTRTFMDAFDAASFVPEYGTWYDRFILIVRGDPDLIARILRTRPDLSEIKISSCLVSTRKCLAALLNERICRNSPHASTKAGYQEELSMFLGKLFKTKERTRLRGAFANPEALNKHFFDTILPSEYIRYEKYLFSDVVSDFDLPRPQLHWSKQCGVRKRHYNT